MKATFFEPAGGGEEVGAGGVVLPETEVLSVLTELRCVDLDNVVLLPCESCRSRVAREDVGAEEIVVL